MIDEKEFNLLKKMVVELINNQTLMQKTIIKTREDTADNLKRMKELAAATYINIDNIHKVLNTHRGVSAS